ncbi:MAG TPA: cob(I)yrinic acid a,c-diamide adenosyltransferase, partial [Ruminiclostridium sp.]|nr:cob(I)yrinic acid a,c-diamide adenosyltransferase [Ruminiclostridium sp.]
DGGQTSLLSKERVNKDDVRIEAYGTVDEANTAMGLAKSLLNLKWAEEILQGIQVELISLNSDMATVSAAEGRITMGHVTHLEGLIDSLEEKRIPQKYFVTPGTSTASAALDLARTIVRRAERLTVRLKRSQALSEPISLYLNRLSDLLFVLARCVEQEELISAATCKVLTVLNELQRTRMNGDFLVKEAYSIPPLPENVKASRLDKAKKIIDAAERKAKEINVPMVIAVVDDGGNLIAQHRMDGSLLASISLAFDKAYTAVALKMSTDQAAKVAVPGETLYGINTANNGKFIVFGGGFPLAEADKIVGGLGVSGGSVEEDMQVARAGLAVW